MFHIFHILWLVGIKFILIGGTHHPTPPLLHP